MKKIYLPVAVALLNLTFLSTAFGLALETLDASTMNKKQIEQKYKGTGTLVFLTIHQPGYSRG